jgi:hypothetical protein
MQTTLEKNRIAESFVNRTDKSFGNKIGLLGALFGCWHKSLSRPLTIGNDSYRACLDCGARKQFDPQTLKTFGSYHYPPIASLNKN